MKKNMLGMRFQSLDIIIKNPQKINTIGIFEAYGTLTRIKVSSFLLAYLLQYLCYAEEAFCILVIRKRKRRVVSASLSFWQALAEDIVLAIRCR